MEYTERNPNQNLKIVFFSIYSIFTLIISQNGTATRSRIYINQIYTINYIYIYYTSKNSNIGIIFTKNLLVLKRKELILRI